MNLKEWEFEFQQRDVHPAIMTDFWLRATRDQLSKQFKLPVKNPDYLFTSTYKGYIKSSNKKEILEKLKEKVKDHEYLTYILERTMGAVKDFDKVMEESAAKLAKDISKDDLADIWAKVEQVYLETVPWYWIPWYLTEENIISDMVMVGLEKYRKDIEKITDFNMALGILIFPKKEVIFQKEQSDLCGLVKMAEEDPPFVKKEEFRKRANEYLNKYAWMRTYFLLPIELLSFDGLVKKVEEAKKSGLLEEHALQEKKKAEYSVMHGKLLDILSNDKELIGAIADASELAWVLTASVEQGILAASKLLPFNKALAKALGVPYEYWVHFRSDEIVSCLKEGKCLSLETINERIVGTAALMQSGVITWMFGEEAKRFSEYVESGAGEIDTNIKEFKGQPAFRGKVRGMVRIALTPSESNALISGEILVTSMTSPDYVPAMRRAAAIVTNEGGLLSHAAIMSREFGKPCIVGTKIAAKVLKTGDMVEVDADKGIIKIIEHAK